MSDKKLILLLSKAVIVRGAGSTGAAGAAAPLALVAGGQGGRDVPFYLDAIHVDNTTLYIGKLKADLFFIQYLYIMLSCILASLKPL